MYIYKTTNLINNKIYIGLSSRPVEKSKSYYGSGKYITQAIKKYGKANFKKEILQECQNKHELNEAEKYWINEYKSKDNNIGYNILDGGYGGGGTYERTPEIIAAAKIKSKETYKPASPEGLERIRQNTIKMNKARKGIKLSEERRRQIGIASSKALTGFKYKKKTCPHCGLIGGGSNMSRYHFDKCKSK